MHVNELKLSVALEEFYIFSRFLDQKCKHHFFEENKYFYCFFFIDLKYRCFQTRLADLKNAKYFKICLWRIFHDFFWTKLIFRIFWYFRKSLSSHVFYFMGTCLTKHIIASSSHFLTIMFSKKCPLPVLTWNFKSHLYDICRRFFLFLSRIVSLILNE